MRGATLTSLLADRVHTPASSPTADDRGDGQLHLVVGDQQTRSEPRAVGLTCSPPPARQQERRRSPAAAPSSSTANSRPLPRTRRCRDGRRDPRRSRPGSGSERGRPPHHDLEHLSSGRRSERLTPVGRGVIARLGARPPRPAPSAPIGIRCPALSPSSPRPARCRTADGRTTIHTARGPSAPRRSSAAPRSRHRSATPWRYDVDRVDPAFTCTTSSRTAATLLSMASTSHRGR